MKLLNDNGALSAACLYRSSTRGMSQETEDWTSGEISWLIDVIAPDRKTTASVLGNFKQVVKGGDLRLHPIIGRLVDKETLEKMGASQAKEGQMT